MLGGLFSHHWSINSVKKRALMVVRTEIQWDQTISGVDLSRNLLWLSSWIDKNKGSANYSKISQIKPNRVPLTMGRQWVEISIKRLQK